jgi:hypothetical protein
VTIREVLLVTPDSGTAYEAACREHQLQMTPGGWGVLLCEDKNRAHWTLVTDDLDYVRTIASAGADWRILAGITVPTEKFDLRAGWPEDWRRLQQG